MLAPKIIPWMVGIKPKFPNYQNNKHHKNHFMKSIQRLNNHSIETSLSAINDLENLVKVNPQYHWITMDMLTNFIRNQTTNLSRESVTNNSSINTRKLIQAAMTVIVNRDTAKDPENEQIDLSYTDLRELNLQYANLKQTNLYRANLSQTNLIGANLAGTILSAANLNSAKLNSANLAGAILSAANLNNANLSSANLHRANLYLASLENTILNDAILDGANLRETKFNY